jgi:protocatechuate 3,4-dioxygenase beta subunit
VTAATGVSSPLARTMTRPSTNFHSNAIAAGALAAVLSAWAFAAPTPSPQPPPVEPPGVELRGRIVGDGGTPIPRAIVRVLPAAGGSPRPKPVRVDTADDGAFVVKGLAGSIFRIRVEAKGYAPLTEGPIPGGATLQLKLKRGFTVTGVVLDRGTRKPIEQAKVVAWEKDADAWGEDAYAKGPTGKDGRFSVADLPAGKVTVEASAPGHARGRTAALAGTPATGKAAPVEVLLDPAGSLSGDVTDTAGAPVVAADVTAYWRDLKGPRSRKGKTGADGHYVLVAAADVEILRMTVRAAGFPPFERPGGAPADGIVDFVLEHGGTVAGIVGAAGAKVPPKFHVTLRPEGSGAAADREFTDPSGSFRLEDVDPGTYTVEVAAEHFAKATKSGVTVHGEQIADVGTLTLESKSTLRGRVISARDETPISGATVHVSLVDSAKPDAASATSESLWTVTTSADGTFTVRGLAAGTFDVSAEQSAYSPVRTRVSFDPEGDSPEVMLRLYRGGSLTGTVVNGSGEPVPGVRIVASPGPEADARVADTGSDGRYFMDGLTPGAYQVTRQQGDQVRAAGAASKPATIVEGETTTVDFDEAPKIILSGTVRKGEEPLPNAAIFLFALDGRTPAVVKKTMTDERGAYRVGLDQGGRYQASVRMGTAGNAFGQNLVMLTIPDQAEVQQDIVFAVNAIVGYVNTPEGQGLKGAIVLAVMSGVAHGETPRQSTTTTAPNGSFRMEGMDPGTYRVSARATGFAPAESFPVVVSEEQPEPEVDLTLERGWLMQGHVVDQNGQPVGDATVVVAPLGAAESGFVPSHTDPQGRFRITSSADGPVCVSAISPRYAPAVQCAIHPPDSDNPPVVELQATPGGSLRIRVVHRGGAPVAGVQTAFRPDPLFPGSDLVIDRNRPKPTDADGTAVVTRLIPGAYIVSLVGRRDGGPVSVVVGEGAESDVQIEVP